MDRPQQYSNVCPSLYGFVPQTLCGDRVASLCMERTGRREIVGDADPMDVCVLTERPISHGDVLIEAIPIGGLRMLDGNEADDKIIAVLKGDAAYGGYGDIGARPRSLLDRLRHYFLTYKQAPDRSTRVVEITDVYGRDEAHEVIRRSREDYEAAFEPLV
jgi:inorganic pyrophosphatase